MLVYREALLADIPAICSLGEEVNLLHHEAWPHIFSAAGDPMRHASHWRQSIGGEESTTYVCEEDGSLLGFVTVLVVRDASPLLQPAPYARVGTVSVAASRRGAGIGTALMRLAERWASHRGILDLRLHVWSFNERAMALYTEMGYEVRSHVLGKRLHPSTVGPR